MVAAGESDHDLALVLHNLVVGDGVLAKNVGRYQAHLVPAKRKPSSITLEEYKIISELFRIFTNADLNY
jgi:hypothetical protein